MRNLVYSVVDLLEKWGGGGGRKRETQSTGRKGREGKRG